jgi:hypothetical protein
MEDTLAKESNMSSTKIIIIFLCGLVVVGALFFAITGKENAEEKAVDTTIPVTDEKMAAPVIQPSNDSFKVTDQEAGMTVVVRQMELTGESWLVVHELHPDGARGNALGAARFGSDAAFAEIPLLRGTEAGKRYSVIIYGDDGDRAFDLKKDTPKQNASGEAISSSFFALLPDGAEN